MAISSASALPLYGTLVAGVIATLLSFFKSSDDLYRQRRSDLQGLRIRCNELRDAICKLGDDNSIIRTRQDLELKYHDPIVPYSLQKYFVSNTDTFNYDKTLSKIVGDIHNQIEKIEHLQLYENKYHLERWDDNIKNDIRISINSICRKIREINGTPNPKSIQERAENIWIWLSYVKRTEVIWQYLFAFFLLVTFLVASYVCLSILENTVIEAADTTSRAINNSTNTLQINST